MEIILRLLAFVLNAFGMLVNKILDLVLPRQRPKYPGIRNPLLKKSVIELVTQLRRGEVSLQVQLRHSCGAFASHTYFLGFVSRSPRWSW